MISLWYIFLLTISVSLTSSIWYNDPVIEADICPKCCQCDGEKVECKNCLFSKVPKKIPIKTTKLNLLGNRINVIKKSDFSKLINLRILQLSNNRINSIEPGAFDQLTSLSKLRLNRNVVQYLPDGLFSKLSKLQKLDLQDNQIQCINEKVFSGLDKLKTLNLERNNIFWISKAVTQMKNLESIHVSMNKLDCNCHLAWLNKFIKHRTDAIKPNPQSVLCSTPLRLSNISISSLSSYEFQCSSEESTNLKNICQTENRVCSKHCRCSSEGIVKCVGKSLTFIPQDLPSDIIELNLKDNNIVILKQGSFAKYKNLKKIILSHNGLLDIEPGAFRGLRHLTSLYLNSNKLKSLRTNSLVELSSLIFLYLHNNDIECLASDSFRGLNRLYLLHLSENKLKSISQKTLSSLSKLRYLYLVHNPLHCDCSLAWLTDFLKLKEAEVSPFALCMTPPGLDRQPVRNLQIEKLQCEMNDQNDEEADEVCVPKISCPPKCTCAIETVNCSNANLQSIPENIYPITKTLILSYNQIKKITQPSPLIQLSNLARIDLSHNEIEFLDPDIFIKNQKLKEINLSHNRLTCVNNQTFRNLIHLETLKLDNNEIRCVVESSFKNNQQLKYLSVDRNPLHCNCHLKWMSEWSRTNYPILGFHSLPTCGSPDILQGTPISSIDEQYFKCDSKLGKNNSALSCDDSQTEELCCSIINIECDKTKKCPKNCKCESTKVDCSEQRLTEIPSEISPDVTELYLDRNNLNTLNESSFKGLRNLKTLVLSYNGITELNKNVLTPLKSLETLILSFNKLQCIHQDAFRELVNLKVLILQSNDVSTIPFQAFQDLRNLNNIALGQNPFHCDCNIKWLNQFFHERFLDNGISLCASPEKMKLKSIYHSKPTEFICSDETEDTYVTAKCDACLKRPCKHNGKCSLLTHHNYKCQCPHPYHGQNCEKRINACFGQPCKNGGICKNVDNYGNYECVCPLGFRGPKCSENINDCSNNKCENGAICEDVVNNYRCKCQKGFRGKYCQQKFTYCQDVNPCLNNGECQLLPNNDFKCICTKGWEGTMCERNIDDCKHNECRNRAECVDLVNSYKCQCRPGFIGKYCNKPAWEPPVSKSLVSRRDIDFNKSSKSMKNHEIISDSVCEYHECLNEGTCVSNPGDQRKSYCRCKPGFSGHICQYLDSLLFLNHSYIEISPPSRGFLMPRGNISIRFMTNSSSGLMLYQGKEKSYLTVNLYNGHVRIGFNLGDKVLGPEGYSITTVNDNKLHSLDIEVTGENLTMYLDNKFHCTLKSKYQSANRYLALESDIYVGGAPKHVFHSAISQYHIDSDPEFLGCIESMHINQKKIDFLKFLSKSKNVKPGCGKLPIQFELSAKKFVEVTEKFTKTIPESIKDIQHDNDTCDTPDICKNGGICKSVKNSKKKFKCICKAGFAGKTCNKRENLCRKKVVRRFIRDPSTSCVSHRKIRDPYCDGSCVDRVMQSDSYNTLYHNPPELPTPRCCQPHKYRSKSIKFTCQNGRQYIRKVHLVKKCKCIPNCSN